MTVEEARLAIVSWCKQDRNAYNYLSSFSTEQEFLYPHLSACFRLQAWAQVSQAQDKRLRLFRNKEFPENLFASVSDTGIVILIIK